MVFPTASTIKLALGLIFPDRGSVRLFGEDAARVELRRRVGFLPENPYLYDYLTGEEFLDFHARLFGLDRATVGQRFDELLQALKALWTGERGFQGQMIQVNQSITDKQLYVQVRRGKFGTLDCKQMAKSLTAVEDLSS